MLDRYQLTESPGRFYREYDAAVIELTWRPVEPLPGVRQLIAELKARSIPVGLASASLRNWVDATVAGLAWRGNSTRR